MSFWSFLGFVEPPRRMVAYCVDPASPGQGVPIGTVPGVYEAEEIRMRLEHNPADYECVQETLGHHRVILHWMGGLVDAVCFETVNAVQGYSGFAPFRSDELYGPFGHFSDLVMRGGRVFNDAPQRDQTGDDFERAGYGQAAA